MIVFRRRVAENDRALDTRVIRRKIIQKYNLKKSAETEYEFSKLSGPDSRRLIGLWTRANTNKRPEIIRGTPRLFNY